MAENPNAPQGPRDFRDIEDYRKNWIVPHLLTDLDSVFLGTRERVRQLSRTRVGGGTFALGVILLTVFDHIGSFFARWDKDPENRESLRQIDNIARMARRLKSTADVSAIVATLGRNALAHVFWPQTAMTMNGWAFGYSLGGDVDEEHDLLYVTFHPLEPKQQHGQVKKVLKLAQNVHVLHKEFADAVRDGVIFREVDPGAFARVQRYSTKVGLPGKRAHKTMDELIEGRALTIKVGATREEARRLQELAVGKGVWEDPELVYYRRTGKVRRVPASST